MRKVLYILFVGILILGTTACVTKRNEAKTSEGLFTITCTGEMPKENGMTQTATAVYEFDKDQYAISYQVTTVSVFDDVSVYKTYKDSGEETAKETTDSSVVYNVKGDDKTNTLTTTYKVTIKSEDLDKADDKEAYRAINILKKSENPETSSYSKCDIKGIDRSKLK